jgi:acetoin utilization deacetylase AcuC-like enzyme
VFDEVAVPAAERFVPDLMLVSAGYDAHWRDPFRQLQFRSSTYHALAARLKALAARLCGGFEFEFGGIPSDSGAM